MTESGIEKEACMQVGYWQELLRLDFAVLLNEEMERRGVTREQLSKRTGVSKRYISEVLGGNAEGLKLSTMSKLMYKLGSKLELNCVVVPELVANGKVSECVEQRDLSSQDIEILRGVIKILSNALRNMLNALEFSEEYASLLEEYISQDDYDAAMKEYSERLNKYAYEPRQLPASEIVKEAKVVLDAIGKELSSDDIADILELGVIEVERALQEYTNRQSE